MSLARFAIEKRTFTTFAAAILVFAGIISYFYLGKLEDPEFTIKQATVITSYPGASPQEVEQEVTEKIERKLQELDEVDYLKSLSQAGNSQIDVVIKSSYPSSKMPEIFTKIRNKVTDIKGELPPGANEPLVSDDISAVFGFLLAVEGDGYTPAELQDFVDSIQQELSLVEGVGRVDTWGKREKVVEVVINQGQLALSGISPSTIVNALREQNLVVDAGSVDVANQRYRIEATGAFASPEEISSLTFRPSALDEAKADRPTQGNPLVRLADFAKVEQSYRDPPRELLHFNGKPAVALAISVLPGSNVVAVGADLDRKLDFIRAVLPMGVEIKRIAWQSDLVDESIKGFMMSLLEAVIIVLVVLWIAMGLANAVIVGTALIMTILATFVVMALWNIDLQRMSLGALVIALGMMVDNAIVVADGAYTRIQKGMNAAKASIEAADGTAWPLLGATLIAVSFFFPIYISPEDSGEYCASLFQVVGASLLLSWVISMTVTPVQCATMLKPGENTEEIEGSFLKGFRKCLEEAIRFRWIVLGGSLAALVIATLAFREVPQIFFPQASRLQFMVDYWAPQGSRIQSVEERIKPLEEELLKDDRVAEVSSFIGRGPPRFYLPVEPERAYSSYAQLIVNIKNLKDLFNVVADTQKWARENCPEALVRTRTYTVGPGYGFRFEARISAPPGEHQEELVALGRKGMDILQATPLAKDIRTNWRTPVKKLVADYDQARGRWTEVSRQDMATSTQKAFDGYTVGLYREGDDLLPIVVRAPPEERANVSEIDGIQIVSPYSSDSVPLLEVADTHLEWENPLIWRRDRKQTLTIQAEPRDVTLSELIDEVGAEFENMKLPLGYSFEWGSEQEGTIDSQKALLPGIIPVIFIVAIILVALFNAYREPLIIVSAIPFAVIGITLGLLVTGQPFGFMALLGAMSLAGMMIKNSIVLIDEIRAQLELGESPYQSVLNAAASRLRPVALAAATTILGVLPLLQDVFWVAMATVIMGGLAVGTLLTMILVPVLYSIFFRIEVEN